MEPPKAAAIQPPAPLLLRARPHRSSGTVIVVLGSILLAGGSLLLGVAMVQAMVGTLCEGTAEQEQVNDSECGVSDILWIVAGSALVLGGVTTTLGVRRCTRVEKVPLQASPPV